MNSKLKIKSEWFFEHEDGSREGPFYNSFTPEGLARIAEAIRSLSSPYLVIGDDTAPGFEITEVFRKPVSVVTRDDNVLRFRTQLLSTEGNGDHQKTCIFVEAADSPGTGVMLNMLRQLWSKTNLMILAVECRITVEGVTA
jgi:hypothetical protein